MKTRRGRRMKVKARESSGRFLSVAGPQIQITLSASSHKFIGLILSSLVDKLGTICRWQTLLNMRKDPQADFTNLGGSNGAENYCCEVPFAILKGGESQSTGEVVLPPPPAVEVTSLLG